MSTGRPAIVERHRGFLHLSRRARRTQRHRPASPVRAGRAGRGALGPRRACTRPVATTDPGQNRPAAWWYASGGPRRLPTRDGWPRRPAIRWRRPARPGSRGSAPPGLRTAGRRSLHPGPTSTGWSRLTHWAGPSTFSANGPSRAWNSCIPAATQPTTSASTASIRSRRTASTSSSNVPAMSRARPASDAEPRHDASSATPTRSPIVTASRWAPSMTWRANRPLPLSSSRDSTPRSRTTVKSDRRYVEAGARTLTSPGRARSSAAPP